MKENSCQLLWYFTTAAARVTGVREQLEDELEESNSESSLRNYVVRTMSH
jgi:hypothetical protein